MAEKISSDEEKEAVSQGITEVAAQIVSDVVRKVSIYN